MPAPEGAETVSYHVRVRPSVPQDSTLLGLRMEVPLTTNGPERVGTFRIDFGTVEEVHGLVEAVADAVRQYIDERQFAYPTEASRLYSGITHPEGTPWPPAAPEDTP